jgi:hypothetical protein
MRMLGELSLDKLRRETLDRCPRTCAHLGSNAGAVFREFTEECTRIRHVMDWTLHLELGYYCRIEDEVLWDELCEAAASAWIGSGPVLYAWIALRRASSPGRVLIGRRARSISAVACIVRGRLSHGADAKATFEYQVGLGEFATPAREWSQYEPRTVRHPIGSELQGD